MAGAASMSKGLPWTKWSYDRWLRDAELRACSFAARGLWADLLAYMDSDQERGHLTLNGAAASTRDIARLVGAHQLQVEKLLAELERNGVFSRDCRGAIFCRHMVRETEEHDRHVANGRLGGNPALVQRDQSASANDSSASVRTSDVTMGVTPGVTQGVTGGVTGGVTQGVTGGVTPPVATQGKRQKTPEINAIKGERGPSGVNPDKRREEKIRVQKPKRASVRALPLLRVLPGGAPPAAPPQSAPDPKGSRLPTTWEPSPAERAYAEQRGLDPDRIAQDFRGHWLSKPGKDGRKLDWSLVWQTWCRREVDMQARRSQPRRVAGGGSRMDWLADFATGGHSAHAGPTIDGDPL